MDAPGCSAVRGPLLCCGGRPQVPHSGRLGGPRCALASVLQPTPCSASGGPVQPHRPALLAPQAAPSSGLRWLLGVQWGAAAGRAVLSPRPWGLGQPSPFGLLQPQGRPGVCSPAHPEGRGPRPAWRGNDMPVPHLQTAPGSEQFEACLEADGPEQKCHSEHIIARGARAATHRDGPSGRHPSRPHLPVRWHPLPPGPVLRGRARRCHSPLCLATPLPIRPSRFLSHCLLAEGDWTRPAACRSCVHVARTHLSSRNTLLRCQSRLQRVKALPATGRQVRKSVLRSS